VGRSQQVRRRGVADFGQDGDDTGCPILHVDMDAFFASVEVRRRPELRGRPVVVGGVGPRGVVSSASYEARGYGVRSAMPTARARQLCPAATFLPPDFAAYSSASDAVMTIMGELTPLVEQLSVDEAFLDVSGAMRLFGRPAVVATEIRRRIAAEQQLTCSVGVAASKFLAKLASTRAKPDGLLVVPAARSLEFLHPLPVAALWGVGDRAAEVLARLGLRTIGAIAQAPIGMLRQALGEAAASQLHELAWARDPRPVSLERADKSMSAETTFDVDVADPDVIRHTLLSLSGRVAGRLRRAELAGRTVAIKVRLADFRTLNRSRTLATPTDVARDVFATGWALYQALAPGDRIRLIGVRVEQLVPADQVARQPALGDRDRGWREVEQAGDAAVARYGSGAVRPASLLPRLRPEAGKPVRAGPDPPGAARLSPERSVRNLVEPTIDPLSDPLLPS
jgi:DNA polymerase IV